MKTKKTLFTFLGLLTVMTSIGYSQCLNCKDFSNTIIDNGNGTYTALNAQAYFWEVENCDGSAAIVGSNTNQTIDLNPIQSGQVKVIVTRFVNGNCLEACKTITCNTGTIGLSCPENVAIKISTEGQADGDCTGSLAVLDNVNADDISHVNWSWWLGPRVGGSNGTIVNGSVSAYISYPMDNWTGYRLVVSAEIVLNDGTICNSISEFSELDCGPVGIAARANTYSNNNFSIYPNPVNSVLNLKNLTQKVSVVLIKTSTGKLLKRIENLENDEIEMSNFKNGLYFISVLYENGETQTNKIILEK